MQPSNHGVSQTQILFDARELLSDNRVKGFVDGTERAAELCKTSDQFLIWQFAGTTLEWHWRPRKLGSRLIIENEFVNVGAKNIQLGKMFCCDARAACMNSRKDVVFSLVPCGKNDRGLFFPEIHSATDANALRESAVKIDFFDRAAPFALQVGFLSFQRALTRVRFETDATSAVARVSAEMDFAGWELAANASTPGETFTIAVSENPFALMEEWADLAAKIISPSFRKKPALGISGGTWGMGRFANIEDFKLANARKAAELLKGLGLEFVWISIANLPGGNPGAWLDWNHESLPSGIEVIVKELEKCGLKLGFWFAPFLISSHLTGLVEELDEAILRNPAGEKLVYYPVWSHGDAGLLPIEKRPCCYGLDPSHPLTKEFVRKSLLRYREAGVRYYMVDFIEAGAGAIQRHAYLAHHDKTLVAGPEVFAAGMKLVREAAGPDTFLLASTGPFFFDAGFVDAIRVGNDFGEGRRIMPNSGFYPASFVINGGFTAAERAIQCAATQYYTHNKLYQNDSGNVLTVDLPLPLESARIHATIHGLSGCSTMLGDDFCAISPARLDLIKKTLPRDSEVARPLDLFSSAPDSPRLFHRKVEQPWGAYSVLAVYNMSSNARRENIPFELLALNPDTPCHVWEFWGETYLGSVKGALDVEIPAESARVFRLTPNSPVPIIIGSNMHLLMGLKEVVDCSWDNREKSLSVTLERPTGEEGAIFFHMPEGWHVRNSSEFHIARNRDGKHGELVIHAPCSFTTHRLQKKIYFGRHDDSTHAFKIEPE